MMKSVLLCIALVATISNALADGLPLKNGRYPGEVLIFQLTKEQKKVAHRFWSCHLKHFRKMNAYTPYVFSLTKEQAEKVTARVGYAPKYFEIYETRKGFNDAGPHWNLALRYSESQIEIPVPLLLPDGEASKEHEEQGWERTNPCFKDVNVR